MAHKVAGTFHVPSARVRNTPGQICWTAHGMCLRKCPLTADASRVTVLTRLTALTGLTADIVDENELIGWVNSLAIGSSAFAVNNVNQANPVRGQCRQSCQHRQCRQIAAALWRRHKEKTLPRLA
ncbi:MAG: hypothetical protein LW850_24035 [Planctomycetaceae bacterium]|jgi:hypothetical protein|nr:hypothetical protein [Planctomycetaceae bacterium]